MNAYKELIHELDALNDEQVVLAVELLRSLRTSPTSENTSNNISETQTKRAYGVLKGKITMSEDFDQPLDDFKEYM
ncbi:MAG: DUF2281 domain-containing protein [Candidatus Kapabacteria bacterium]|nr:DUF2281 domain-containing protein [Candidatus Kapabacteria bacterium]